jgi:hypothetical protein
LMEIADASLSHSAYDKADPDSKMKQRFHKQTFKYIALLNPN